MDKKFDKRSEHAKASEVKGVMKREKKIKEAKQGMWAGGITFLIGVLLAFIASLQKIEAETLIEATHKLGGDLFGFAGAMLGLVLLAAGALSFTYFLAVYSTLLFRSRKKQ